MAKKQQLGYKEIEERLRIIKDNHVPAEEIGYHILYSFGKGERDIARYKEGKGILKTFEGLLIKGLFCFKSTTTLHLSEELESLKADNQVLKALPKIIAVSDGKTILAYDLREKDTYENKVDRLYCDFAFFYPLMDVERVHYVEESPADIKAAEKLAKLHDELRAYNEFNSDNDLHDLNIFITRLLFCFFAEDTGIFEENLFSASIQQYTKPDGSDLSEYLDAAFNIMDCDLRNSDTLSIIKQFPYVNGGLFAKHIQIPKMGAKARKIIIECGELDWKDINPDIFGSMIQAVVNPEERANQGMHYTSVPNIMKVINPLFLDELREEHKKLEEQQKQLQQQLDLGALKQKDYCNACAPIEKKCRQLLLRISKMKFFDPACGSGNFLIITYKSLRLLEMDILKVIRSCKPGQQELNFIDGSCITLKQFYGIELLDFPHEVAMLSLWLAEHQMNRKFSDEFKVNTRALPLHNITQIVCGNACRIDWKEVCPHEPEDEVFVFGNPPYVGGKLQTKEQKDDLRWVLSIPFFISCIRQQNPLTVLSKIILRKVKQFNLPPPKKMRDFCIFEDTPRLFLLGNRQFTFIAHNLDVAEDVVGQICHRHIRLRPYNPYCPDNKAVHTLLFKTEYVLDKATGLGLAPVLSLLFFCQRMIPTAFLADYRIHAMLLHG